MHIKIKQEQRNVSEHLIAKRRCHEKELAKASEHFILRHMNSQKGATKRSGAIKKNLQKFKNISFRGILTRKKVLQKEVMPLKRTCNSLRTFHFEAYQLARKVHQILFKKPGTSTLLLSLFPQCRRL